MKTYLIKKIFKGYPILGGIYSLVFLVTRVNQPDGLLFSCTMVSLFILMSAKVLHEIFENSKFSRIIQTVSIVFYLSLSVAYLFPYAIQKKSIHEEFYIALFPFCVFILILISTFLLRRIKNETIRSVLLLVPLILLVLVIFGYFIIRMIRSLQQL